MSRAPLSPATGLPSPAPVIADAPAREARVWDRFTRLFHWSLAALVATALSSGFLLPAPWIALHVASGLAIAALVAARVVWGFLGSRHARFTDFVRGPRAVLAHVRALAGGAVGRHLGHNPVGGAMILALLATLALIVVSGLVAWGGVLKAGPLSADIGFTGGSAAKALHEAAAIGLCGLVAAHVAGVILESRRSGENLIGAMITGRKRGVEPEPAAGDPARPRLAAAITAGLLAAAATAGLGLAARTPAGLPAATPRVVARECGACHFAYPASLLPRASWTALMAGLGDHFGEVATLDAATAAEIGAFLAGHAAESADTKAANRLRTVDPAAPFTITASPFWRRVHAALPAAAFTATGVGGKGNCAGCHGDAASGRFYPGAIRLPSTPRS